MLTFNFLIFNSGFICILADIPHKNTLRQYTIAKIEAIHSKKSKVNFRFKHICYRKKFLWIVVAKILKKIRYQNQQQFVWTFEIFIAIFFFYFTFDKVIFFWRKKNNEKYFRKLHFIWDLIKIQNKVLHNSKRNNKFCYLWTNRKKMEYYGAMYGTTFVRCFEGQGLDVTIGHYQQMIRFRKFPALSKLCKANNLPPKTAKKKRKTKKCVMKPQTNHKSVIQKC